MARLYLTLLVVPLLAACATSHSVRTQSEPSYLEGVNSEYSIRADEIQTRNFDKLCKELPDALVAGNEDLTVITSVFRKGKYIGVDMVVHNHGSKELKLHRADMYILDFLGNRLEAVEEWKEAENYGLRSRVRKNSEYVYLDGKRVTQRSFGEKTQASMPNTKGTAPHSSTGSSGTMEDAGTDLDMLTQPVELHHYDVTAPETLVIKPGQKKPYWAYFEAESLQFPITTVVRLDGKRLVFRFNGPEKKTESSAQAEQ